jgi:hypothetical protein
MVSDSYKAQYPPLTLSSSYEQEAMNCVLTGTAAASHSTGDGVIIYTVPPPSPEPPVEPLPEGPPSELATLHMDMNDSTDNIVALENKAFTPVVGSILQIDAEYMAVTDAANRNNLQVSRAACGSDIGTHTAGVEVTIWGAPPPTDLASGTGVLHMPMNDSTDSIVALEDKASSVAAGSVLGIDAEYMMVTDATNLNNLAVTRATCGSAIGPHVEGAQVTMWGNGSSVQTATATKAKGTHHNKAAAASTSKQIRPETAAEERRREDAEDDKAGEVHAKKKK